MSRRSLIQLGRRCPLLQSLHLTTSKSVTSLTIDSIDSFHRLRIDFPRLTEIHIMFQDDLLPALPEFFVEPNKIQRISLWTKGLLLSAEDWQARKDYIYHLNDSYRTKGSLQVSLEESD